MPGSDLKTIGKRLQAAAAKYPEAYEDHPWGETVYKVKGKVFVFMGVPADSLGLSVKLPDSSDAALMLPFTRPTPYGLGKAGWISASFEKGDDVPEGLLLEWLEESYRAVAPKKLVKLLDESASFTAPARTKRRAPAAKKKTGSQRDPRARTKKR